MKKKSEVSDDLRGHYDFDYTKMKPNRFAGEVIQYKRTYVTLDEDVSAVFQSSESVNTVLRSAISAMRTTARKSTVAAKSKPRTAKRRRRAS